MPEDTARLESETKQMPLFDDRQGADISDCGTYRYRLWRTWNPEQPALAWIMLNPSTADATDDDPTVRRCIGFAKDWGYGGIVVGNLFALRSTDPSVLKEHPDPVGPRNDDVLRELVDGAGDIVAAWGTKGTIQNRGQEVRQMLDGDLIALDTTKDGHPVHPLYQPADAEPEVL